MTKQVLSRSEFMEQTGIAVERLKEWEELKMVVPAGFTDDQVPFYYEDSLEKVQHIKQLTDLGYGLADIQKIIKKVGLPKVSAGKNEDTNHKNYLTVGSLAEQVGVSTRTIKHWEDKGIIEPDTRSSGGFRFYGEHYVYLCKLIRDLQLFGYTLDEIKMVSDLFRDFLAIQENLEVYPGEENSAKLTSMLQGIETLFKKMDQFKEGIQRWESLVKKKKKEILTLKNQNKKRIGSKANHKEERKNG